MPMRHEWKIEITAGDRVALAGRLRAFMRPDPHADADGRYLVRSLYFDSPTDRALREKLDGISRREKFRIRYYNGDTGFLRLEKKYKQNGLCRKTAAPLTAAQAQAIIDNDLAWMPASPYPLLRELYCKIQTERLRPRTVVDYMREAFVYGPGNVRVTFDSDIRTGLQNTDFLQAALVTIPAGDAPLLMEVKWDAFLPDIVRDAIQLPGRRAAAFSKYAQCRIYG